MAAREVILVAALFPTGSPVLVTVVEECWQACSASPGAGFWVRAVGRMKKITLNYQLLHLLSKGKDGEVEIGRDSSPQNLAPAPEFSIHPLSKRC